MKKPAAAKGRQQQQSRRKGAIRIQEQHLDADPIRVLDPISISSAPWKMEKVQDSRGYLLDLTAETQSTPLVPPGR